MQHSNWKTAASKRPGGKASGPKADTAFRIRAWRAVDLTIRTPAPSRHDAVFATSDESERLRLETALRREQALGRAGHWAYDINRHIGLRQALTRIGAGMTEQSQP